MNKIIIYTKNVCPYCVKAKALLKSKNAEFTEINIEDDVKAREEMLEKSEGKKTVPQIFINDQHIGGCDDLHKLEEEGKLDELLKNK